MMRKIMNGLLNFWNRLGITHRLSPKTTQNIAMVGVWLGGAITLMILLVIVGYVMIQGIPHISWDFMTTDPQGGLSGEGGIRSVIQCTIVLIVVTMVILTPLGVGGGIYLAEYAPDNRLTRLIRYGVDVLAGVPSIVFGLFGFALLVTVLHFNFSILSGALTLVFLLLPTLIRTSEEALKAVPHYHREASLAIGATKWQTIWRVVLPASLPGIITGIILCIGRAIGETACLYVTMGGAATFNLDVWPPSDAWDMLLSPGRSLSLHVFYLAMDTNAFEKAMATGTVLIVTIVVINSITNFISHRFYSKMTKGA
jgi:phosphate transport system permease protein